MRREIRLRKRSEFLHARRRGQRYSNRLLALQVARADHPVTRFGLAVGKRVGGAVVRNRVKRRLRACLSTLDVPAGFNIVVSARPAAARADYHMLLESVRSLARAAHVLSAGGHVHGGPPAASADAPGRTNTEMQE